MALPSGMFHPPRTGWERAVRGEGQPHRRPAQGRVSEAKGRHRSPGRTASRVSTGTATGALPIEKESPHAPVTRDCHRRRARPRPGHALPKPGYALAKPGRSIALRLSRALPASMAGARLAQADAPGPPCAAAEAPDADMREDPAPTRVAGATSRCRCGRFARAALPFLVWGHGAAGGGVRLRGPPGRAAERARVCFGHDLHATAILPSPSRPTA